ncbi:hypothetical protein DMENIID0001_132080 [Sergentomyia squamirostris]
MAKSDPPRMRVLVKQEFHDESQELYCRLCVERCEVDDFYSVFTENLPEHISRYFGVIIEEDDNWPQYICTMCLTKFHDVLKFVETIRASESILKNMFGERHVVSESNNSVRIKEEVPSPQDNAQIDVHPEAEGGILRQMLMGDISQCPYIVQPPAVPTPTTSLLRAQLLKPLQPRPPPPLVPPLRPTLHPAPLIRRRRRRALKADALVALQLQIESFYRMQCDLCHEIFLTYRNLEDHFRQIHGRKAYIPCCRVKFRGLSHLGEHMKYHANPQAFRCPECGKCFKYQSSLDLHRLNSHTPHEMRPYSCIHCPQRFVTAKMQRQHALVHAAAEERMHPCPNCERSFERVASLKKHIQTHHAGEMSISCQTCGQLFQDTQSLESHRRSSHRPRKLHCPVCEKTFRHQYNLTEHIRLHSDSEKPFECDLCGQRCFHKQDLRAHIELVHLRKKPTRSTFQLSSNDDFELLNSAEQFLPKLEPPPTPTTTGQDSQFDD